MDNKKLAKERTTMADERTLLAYIRTALSLFIFGIAVQKFYPEYYISRIIFFASFIGGIFLILIGFFQFIRIERKME